MTVNEMWDELASMGVSEETLTVVATINGYTEEAMEDILYVKFGYRSFEQMYEDH